jgi:hypothetical protein
MTVEPSQASGVEQIAIAKMNGKGTVRLEFRAYLGTPESYGAVVITGSFNFTKGAEYDNAENLLVIRSKQLAAQYTRNWEAHAGHSEPYAGRGRRAPMGSVRPHHGSSSNPASPTTSAACGRTPLTRS